ncbi:MAG: radical SAM protein [Pseudanabaena sp. M090S1SP1A06QC]|jgi:DNA repair photolyase|nr:radical SAM protein [Pseudanabaena sp. M090S1SP1A06QC]MCA6621690.1 radical SAM protein [Pseudanabaena sp. M165S2SP1A06QC]HBC43452.1 radical SAM protein [Pseudanabaena sp.]
MLFGNTEIYTKDAKSLLTKASGFINAYDFTLNPYQGCQYGCSYCYAAAFSPNQKLRKEWGNWVIIKQNAVELLKVELERWNRKYPNTPPRIYMSSVTDPYQAIESKQKLTRHLLEVMTEFQPILVIQTRSPMIVRDIDILQKLEYLRINISIPTGSESVRKDFEPKSPSITSRLQALGKLQHSLSNAKYSVTITPLLPTWQEDKNKFLQKLAIAERIVIQPFHSNQKKSLVASTREDAIALQSKYAWWYDNEAEQYENFKQELLNLVHFSPSIDIREGKNGFGYDE